MEVGNGIECVKLKKLLVDFLVRLNIERREDSTVDKAFVKGLVIGVFSVQKIKSNENLSSDLVAFISGMFHRFHIKKLPQLFDICFFLVQQICFCFVLAVTRIVGRHLIACYKKHTLKFAA